MARLGVGIAPNTSAAAYIRAKATDDYSILLKQLAGQTADMWRVEDTAGNPLIRLTGGGDLESGTPGFTSGQTGWQIAANGDAEFNDVFVRGELHATTFVADEMHATGGTLAVMTVAKVAPAVGGSDNTLPSTGSSFTLNVQASYDTGLCYFSANDVIRIKTMGEIASGGSLDLYDIYLTVTSVGSQAGRDLANGEAGYHPLTCVRRYGGATGFIIPPGSAAVRWAKVSQGSGYTGGIILTSDLQYSPYIDIFTVDATQTGATWQSAPVTPKPRVRVGNLRGVLGKSADEWGLAAGTDLSASGVTARYIVASDLGLTLNNVDLRLYSGSTPTVDIAASGAVSMGSDLSSALTTTFQFYPATGALRVGATGATGKANLYWDGAAMHLRQNFTPVITLDSDGSSYFAGPMSLGTGGGIYQGTGTFASPTTGLKLFRSSSIGVLETYNAGTPQVRLDTDGAFKTGWNGSTYDVVMNANGLTLTAFSASGVDTPMTDPTKRVNWKHGATTVGYIGAANYSLTGTYGLEMMAATGVGIRVLYDADNVAVSSFQADGWLALDGGTGGRVDIGPEVYLTGAGDIHDVGTIDGSSAEFSEVNASAGLYAHQALIVGSTKTAIAEQESGVVTLYQRTTHPANPPANFVSFYIYRNTGTAKHELTMRNRLGATVKIAEIAY